MNKLSRSQIIQGSVVAGLIGTVFLLLYLSNANTNAYLSAGWITAVLLLILLSNWLITRFLNKRLPWLEYGNKRFYWQLGLGIISSLIIINLSYLIFKLGLTNAPPVNSQMVSMNVIGILVLLPTISITFGIQFLKNWKNAQIQSEEFQKESIKAELETLKNHLDPHFLFNNLNVLSSLISKDQKLSQRYLEKFAEVYRIILQSSSEELVVLKQELDFISAYMYLMEIRFEDTIQVETDIKPTSHQLYLPPLTLQMLIENAIKHNSVSEIRPLKINVECRDQYLVVKNNLQPKKIESRNSSKTGLRNIKRRYRYFTKREVQVIQNDKSFIVKVPLIDISSL